MRCEQCHAEKLVAFSCKKRGFCPYCGGRRIPKTAALLADGVLPDRPLRQWVLSLPHALRFLLEVNSEALTLVLGEVYRTISRHLIGKAGLSRRHWMSLPLQESNAMTDARLNELIDYSWYGRGASAMPSKLARRRRAHQGAVSEANALFKSFYYHANFGEYRFVGGFARVQVSI